MLDEGEQAVATPGGPSALNAPSANGAPNVQQLLDLVNADIRGQITTGDRERLTGDPQRWLGVLSSVLRSVRDQIDERGRLLETELARPERSVSWSEIKKRHGEWLRKARHFERLVEVRTTEVRRLLPSDDLYALLHDGTSLRPDDAAGVASWQVRARRALLQR